MPGRRRALVYAGLVVSMALLLPGILLPVLSVRGVIHPGELASMAPALIEAGLTDEAVATLRPLLNPVALALVELSPGGLRGALVEQLTPQVVEGLARGEPLEVYAQTRSILGAVRHLYQVGSGTAATLILIFSVVVPMAKAGLVVAALLMREPAARRQTLGFVEIIAKWSMADVFAVAVVIAYLAAQASAAPPGSAQPSPVAFSAAFGPGFYWFAAYCLVSLAVHQATARRWLAG